MSDIQSIVPIIDDELAHKIISLWPKVQDPSEISELLMISDRVANTKVRLLKALGLVVDGGFVSQHAKNLVLAKATQALKRS